MFEFIMATYSSVKVTLAVTGLPIVITGEVMSNSAAGIINIKPDDGPVIHINAAKIAAVF